MCLLSATMWEFHTGRKFDSADLKANWDRILYDVGDKGRGLGLLSEVSNYGATGEYEWTVTIRGDSPVFLPNQTGIRCSRRRGIR